MNKTPYHARYHVNPYILSTTVLSDSDARLWKRTSQMMPSVWGGRGGVRRSQSVAFPRQKGDSQTAEKISRGLRKTGRVYPLSKGFTNSVNGRRRPRSPTHLMVPHHVCLEPTRDIDSCSHRQGPPTSTWESSGTPCHGCEGQVERGGPHSTSPQHVEEWARALDRGSGKVVDGEWALIDRDIHIIEISPIRTAGSSSKGSYGWGNVRWRSRRKTNDPFHQGPHMLTGFLHIRTFFSLFTFPRFFPPSCARFFHCFTLFFCAYADSEVFFWKYVFFFRAFQRFSLLNFFRMCSLSHVSSRHACTNCS